MPWLHRDQKQGPRGKEALRCRRRERSNSGGRSLCSVLSHCDPGSLTLALAGHTHKWKNKAMPLLFLQTQQEAGGQGAGPGPVGGARARRRGSRSERVPCCLGTCRALGLPLLALAAVGGSRRPGVLEKREPAVREEEETWVGTPAAASVPSGAA